MCRNGKLTAKVNEDNEHAELLEQPDVWPHNGWCRKWMSENCWRRKLQQYDNEYSECRNGE